MNHPSFEEFKALAAPNALVPVYREVMADLETPVSAYMKIAKDQSHAFLLESVDHADGVGRYSFLGAAPSVIFQSKGHRVTVVREGATESFESDDPLQNLRELMSTYEPVEMEGVPALG